MDVEAPQTDRLLTRAEVAHRVGLGTSQIYRAMREHRFPLPIRIGITTVRWSARELEEWIASRPRAMGIRGDRE